MPIGRTTASQARQTASCVADGKEMCSHLLDMADCNTREASVVLVHLSRFEIVKHQPAIRRFAIELLTGLTVRRDARLFEVAEADLVLFCHQTPADEVNSILSHIGKKVGVSNGQSGAAGDGQLTFTTWFDLTDQDDFEALTALANRHDASCHAPGLPGALRKSDEPTLTPSDLETIRASLSTSSINGFIQQQKALLLGTQRGVTPLLTETYLSISKIKERFAPRINVFARPALFHFLTVELDRHLLTALAANPPASKAGQISLNLNIASVFSSEFERLDRAWTNAQRPIIEIQFVDILTDAKAFAEVRDDLRARGYQILIDGLKPESILSTRVEHLGAGFVKILWCEADAQATKSKAPDAYRARIDAIGRDRLILARAETEEAMKWALGLGISRFQGHYIDRLVKIMAAKKLI